MWYRDIRCAWELLVIPTASQIHRIVASRLMNVIKVMRCVRIAENVHGKISISVALCLKSFEPARISTSKTLLSRVSLAGPSPSQRKLVQPFHELVKLWCETGPVVSPVYYNHLSSAVYMAQKITTGLSSLT